MDALSQSNCQRTRAPGGTRTHVSALRVRCPRRWTTSACCHVCQVGPVGIEPTSSGLRDRRIALSATVPSSISSQSARRELNPRPASYKDAALTVELRATASRVGGDRTHTLRIKSPPCCQLHHDPEMSWDRVCNDVEIPRSSPSFMRMSKVHFPRFNVQFVKLKPIPASLNIGH